MEMICFRVPKKVKHEFRLNCMKNKRSMQFILDNLVTQYNNKHRKKEEQRETERKDGDQ